MDLTTILSQESEDIAKSRKILFPLFGFNIISGYNIYVNKSKLSKICARHLHTDLNPDDKYRLELEKLLANANITTEEKLGFTQIHRLTGYRLEEGWEADEYYNIHGEQISKDEAKILISQGDIIIGGGIQSELMFEFEDKRELQELYCIFRKHLNAFRLDKKGYITQEKKYPLLFQPIDGAWEVPVLLLEGIQSYPIDFTPITEISIPRKNYYISIACNNTSEEVQNELQLSNISFSTQTIYANRLFAEFINNSKT